MKKQELIKLIEALPDNADIVVNGYYCEILGDYQYNDQININETTALKDKHNTYYNTISNYASGEEIKIFVLE